MTILPLLRATAAEEGSDVRIINVSSGAYNLTSSEADFTSFESLNDKAPKKDSCKGIIARYALSKACAILFTKELQWRLDLERIKITVLAVNPGTVASGKR
ncbi:hypothetical protein FRC02_000242 [Tulasnella sp. 418]|nr:hypothetical protein FRC02_000242 [Tulasnella sp. 418]